MISLWGFADEMRPRGAFASVDGIPHFLSLGAAEHLRALEDVFELVWCTGWEEKANDYLPHAVGLGPFDYLSFDTVEGTTPGHWKLGAIDAYARDRPAAWIDDAHDEACHAWARAREAPTLLVGTDPAEGLVAAHARELRAWAESLS